MAKARTFDPQPYGKANFWPMQRSDLAFAYLVGGRTSQQRFCVDRPQNENANRFDLIRHGSAHSEMREAYPIVGSFGNQPFARFETSQSLAWWIENP